MRNEVEIIHEVPSAEIVFHGNLSQFGPFKGRVGTPLTILASAFVLRPGLKAALIEGEYKLYRGEIEEGHELEPISLHLRLAPGQKFHIVPVAAGDKGSKGASVGKTIAGAVIAIGAVAAAFAFAPAGATLAATLGGNAGLGISYGAIAMFGVSIMMGGVSGLLGMHNHNTNSDASTTLTGALNSTEQGGCIPLIYGKKVRAGSVVASLGYSAQEWGNTSNNPRDNPSSQIDTIGQNDDLAGTTGNFDDLADISGTGRKGKSGASGSEAPNNLRSKAIVTIIDVVGQGPGVQLVNGPKSIYFNGTPLMSAEGKYNFYGVKWAWRNGGKEQDPVPGFPAAEDTTTVGTKVAYFAPVTQTLSSETATSARVVIQIPALYHTDKSSGVLEPGPDVNITVEVMPAGGSWSTVVDYTLSGQKNTSPAELAWKFDLPGATGTNPPTEWQVRVSRNSPDSTAAGDASDIYFQYLDAITDHQLMYPDCAYCALSFDSSAFGDSVPTRSYDVTGKDISVPANYDPATRTYSTTGIGTQNGTWDGVTWKIAQACDDPCWALLDLIVSQDFGLAVPESKLGSIEADLYEASQYASAQIPDGYGGLEPRYSFNVCVTSAGDAFKVLTQFTSAFRGLAFWANGGIAISADMPRTPSMLVTNANVQDGNFSYEGTALSGRHNIAYCSYLNIDNATSFTDIETYTDQASVASTGPRITKMNGFGITSRGQALRTAHWYIDTELHQTQTVTYQCGVDHAAVRPGEVIEIADEFYQGVSQGGRVPPGATVSSIALDRVFTPNPSLQYTFKALADDGSVMSSPVQTFSTITPVSGPSYTVVNLSTALPQAPSANTIWAITEPTQQALPQWRVVSVTDKGNGIYQITALFHDPAKFARVENNLPFNEVVYSQLPSLLPTPLPPPTNISVQDYTVGSGATTIIRVDIGWTGSSDIRVLGYQVRAINNDTGNTLDYDAKQTSQYEIDNLAAANWTFGVRSYGKNGATSEWTDTGSYLINGSPLAPTAILGLTAQGATRKVYLTWTASTIRNLLHYEVQRAPDNNGTPGTFSSLGFIDGTTYTDNDSQSLTPVSSWWYQVRAIDTYGTLGAWCPSVKATTTYLLTDDLEQSLQNTAAVAQQLYNSIGQPHVVQSNSLPSTSGYPDGSIISLVNSSGQGVLYKLTNGSWQQMIGTVTIANDGKLTADQIGEIQAAQVTQPLTQNQLDLLNKAKNDSSLNADQQAEVKAAIASGSASQSVMNLLANVSIGQQSLTQQQLNNLTLSSIAGTLSSQAVSAINLAKTSGQISPQQISSVLNTQIQGQLTSGQIASITAAQITGQMAANQISNISAQQITGQITSAQVANIDASKMTGQITGTQISNGSVSTPQLAAGAVLAQNIAAGAITSEKLSIANPSNLIANSNFELSSYGWGWGGGNAPNLSLASTTQNPSGAPAISIPALFVSYSSTGSNDYMRIACSQNIAVVPGKLAQLNFFWANIISLYVQFSIITFYDASGNSISSAVGGSYITSASNGQYKAGGAMSDNFSRWMHQATVPENASYAQIVINVNTNQSGTVSGFLSRVVFTNVDVNVTQAVDWTPGGVTQIDGSQVNASSIKALQLDVGAVTAQKIAVGAVTASAISAGAVTANSIAANTITANQIQLGSLNADVIAAGAIGVKQLAANAVYTDALQASSITSEKMSVGSVLAQSIAAGAVTAEKLSIGTPNNQISNGALNLTTDGWRYVGGSGTTVNSLTIEVSTVPNLNMARFAVLLNQNGQGWADIYYQSMSVVGGQWYEAQISGYGWGSATGIVYLAFLDGNGNTLQVSMASTSILHRDWGQQPTTPQQLDVSWVKAQAPSGSVTVNFVVRYTAQSGNTGDNWGHLYFYNALFGKTVPNASQPMPWTPGGVTQISGGQIMANSITANQIAGNVITANQIAGQTIIGWNIRGNTITSDQIAANTIIGWNIKGQTITSDQIAANTITSQQIAAGSITAESLAIGSPANQIANSCFDTAGAYAAGWLGGYAWGDNSSNQLALTPVNQNGFTFGWLSAPGGVAISKNTGIAYYYRRVPVSGNGRYCVSASVGCTNMTAWIEAWFYDKNGNEVGYLGGSHIQSSDWSQPSNMLRSFGFGVAPASAVTAEVRIVVHNETGADVGNGPGAAFTRIMFGEVGPNVSQPPVWVPGNSTSIDGGTVMTGSLSADKIVAGSITAAQIYGGTITAQQIAVQTIQGYNIAFNTITGDKIFANSITSAQIQAGTITGDQIAAGSIHAGNLAVENLIVKSAQIADLVVGTQHLQDSSVTVYASGYWDSNQTSQGTLTLNPNNDSVGILSVSTKLDPGSSEDGGSVRSVILGAILPDNTYYAATGTYTASLSVPIDLPAGQNNQIRITCNVSMTQGRPLGGFTAVCLARMK